LTPHPIKVRAADTTADTLPSTITAYRTQLPRMPHPVRRKPLLTVPRVLLCGDLLALTLALLVRELFWRPAGPQLLGPQLLARVALDALTVALAVAVAHLLGLYENDHKRADHTTVDEIFSLFQTVTITAWTVLALDVLAGGPVTVTNGLLALWILALVYLFCGRLLARACCNRLRGCRERTVIVGAGQVGNAIATKLMRNPRLGLDLVGFVDGQPLTLSGEPSRAPVLGDVLEIEELIRSLGIERVIVAFSSDYDAQLLTLMRDLSTQAVRVDIVPRLFESFGLGANLHTLEGLPLIGLTPLRPSRLSLAVKRLLDTLIATLGLLVLSPLLAAVALAIKLDSPGPVLYLSERVGRGGRRFRLCKFRSMQREACRGERYGGERAEELFDELMGDTTRRAEFQRTHKLRDDPRVTRLGAFLRRSSLDELPQLLNVIRGELSLVGPRPVMAYEVEKLEMLTRGELERTTDAINLSHPFGYWELDLLRPGMTGYWQVTARSDVGYEERLHLDLIYTMSWSLKLDLLIAMRTLGALAGRGAY
jgi:exopolysaccharide biosynthesis polyprenyl glycosylphosphotransferase